MIILVLTMSIIVLSGCNQNKQKEQKPINVEAVRTGKAGISTTFAANMPPTEAVASESFNVAMLIKNEGATDIKDEPIIVTLSGYDQTFYEAIPFVSEGLSSSRATFTKNQAAQNDDQNIAKLTSLKGKSVLVPVGEKDMIIYALRPKKDSKNKITLPPGDYAVNLLATTCYPYQTVYVGTICIDPNQNNPNSVETPACKVKSPITLSAGQGGPVAINKLEEDIVFPIDEETKKVVPKVMFKVYFENVGGGKIISRDPAAYQRECGVEDSADLDTRKSQIDLIKISAKIGNDKDAQTISCYLPDQQQKGNDIKLQLTSQTNYVICKANLQVFQQGTGSSSDSINSYRGAYYTTLAITLDYGYVSDVKKKITIKKGG